MKTADAIVVGGGIAGLAVAYHLSQAKFGRIVLCEQEDLLASHSSGRNAAIFRHLDTSASVLPLALRSRDILDSLLPSWLHRRGALFIAQTKNGLQSLKQLADEHSITYSQLDARGLQAEISALAFTSAQAGLLVPDDGVIDIHGVCTALASAARNNAATLLTRTRVRQILVHNATVQGVQADNGQAISSPVVVNACGAWAQQLGKTAQVVLPLIPYRRHLALLEPSNTRVVSDQSPVVWSVDEEVYFRPESGGILASPCDEDSFHPCIPPESELARELLAEKLLRIAPRLADSGIRRSWACLRTFAPDRAMIAGPDPRISGLFWMAGLGGHGMTAGVATGELVANLICGQSPHVSAPFLSPSRFVS